MRHLAIALALLSALAACKQETPSAQPTPVPLPTWVRTATPVEVPTPVRPIATASAWIIPPSLPPASTPPITQIVPAPSPTPVDPPPVGSGPSSSYTGNGNAGGSAAATPTPTSAPTPTPTPLATLPPLPDTWVYTDGTNNDNAAKSSANLPALDYCESDGPPQVSGAAFGTTACPHAYEYGSFTMFEPTTSGGSVVNPFEGNYADGSAGGGAGTCPSPWNGPAPWKATSGTDLPDLTGDANTWLNWVVSPGTSGNALVGYLGSDLHLFPNFGSATYQSATNDIVHGCSVTGNGATVAFDRFEGFMSDNTHGGPISYHAALWDAHIGANYPQGENWAGGVSVAPTPAGCTTPCYASSAGISSPSTYFNGTLHTQGAYVNSNCSSTIPDTTCQTATYASDLAYDTAMQSFFGGLTHRNGSALGVAINGMYNGYDACDLSNGIANVTVGIIEFGTLGSNENGVPQSEAVLRQRVDVASQNAACGGKRFAFLDYLNSSKYNSGTAGSSAPGTPAYEMQMRLHFAFLWALTDDTYPSMMMSWLQGCIQSCPMATTWTDIFGADFATPSGAVEPYFTEALGTGSTICGETWSGAYGNVFTPGACVQGGMLDQNNTVSTSGGTCTAGSSACVVRRIFAHHYVWNLSVCSAYSRANWSKTSGCVHDIGPLIVLINLTGSSITLSQNFLTAAAGSYWSQMHYILEPGCTPLAGLYGNTAGSPLYPNDGLEGTASTTVQCAAGTQYDIANGSAPGAYALSNETSIGTSTGPTLHSQGAVMFSSGAP